MLGFTGGQLFGKNISQLRGSSTLPIMLDETVCPTGEEASLNDCSFLTTSDCIHKEDVVLFCDAPPSPPPSPRPPPPRCETGLGPCLLFSESSPVWSHILAPRGQLAAHGRGR